MPILLTEINWVLDMDTWFHGPLTQNCVLRMCRECRERFPRHRFRRIPLVIDPGLHHGTCVTHVPWCMLGSLACGGGKNVPGIPGACVTRKFTYLVRNPLIDLRSMDVSSHPCSSFNAVCWITVDEVSVCNYIHWFCAHVITYRSPLV